MNNKTNWIHTGDGCYSPLMAGEGLNSLPVGVYKVLVSPTSGIRLLKISSEFQLPKKVYDVGCDEVINSIKTTWNSTIFQSRSGNLGVAFYGYRGTGKTIAAKMLCNEMNLPVILVETPSADVYEFISDFREKCLVFIDEAEKVFYEDEDSVRLLKLLDGAKNNVSKIFLLTLNDLDMLDENTKNRPSRLRYIKCFSEVTPEVVREVIEDELLNKELVASCANLVSSLDSVTIDVVRSIVEEVNIQGELPKLSFFNVNVSSRQFRVMEFKMKRILHNNQDLLCWYLTKVKSEKKYTEEKYTIGDIPEIEELVSENEVKDWSTYRDILTSCNLFSGYETHLHLPTNYGDPFTLKVGDVVPTHGVVTKVFCEGVYEMNSDRLGRNIIALVS